MQAVTIDPSASSVCSISGSTVSFIGVGTCVINANQAGNANFYPAPQVQQSFESSLDNLGVARQLSEAAREAQIEVGVLAEVDAGLGVIDILVNNAGGGFWSPFLDVRAKGQAALVDENFTSVTHFIRGCVPLMPPPPRGGSIINVTSIEAFRAAPGFGIYAAMKAAVESLTKTLALELAGRRIRVNCIAPDAIPTPGDSGLAASVLGEEHVDYGWKIPLGLGSPDDVAAAVLWLASDMSRFVTGTTLHVDGGSFAASGWKKNERGVFES